MSTDVPDAMPQVKLIVWDLDDTLWHGTLSEGAVELPTHRADQVRRLVDRGVMVSISSRNDEDAVRRRLEDAGIWDLFVFPRINWEPKGAQVRDLIEAAQLRPANVLFVDDNHLNREEVAFFSEGIQLADPADPAFEDRIEAAVARGKDDHARTRLAEYKLLEAKAQEAAGFGDNLEFLRSCAIRVEVDEAPSDVDRIAELIARTNQLNYRKVRIAREEVRALLEDERVRCVSVRVRDRFGDYGLVGFAAVRDGDVEQLAFSCRILGMGVERAIYARLGRPHIDVAEPVSAPLDGPEPDWLTVVDAGDARDEAGTAASLPESAPGAAASVLFVGGCDLEQAVAFLDGGDRVTTHFNYSPADRPRLVVHRDSIDYLLSDEWPAGAREIVLADAPFLDERVFSAPDWSAHDHVVYSPLIDYVQAKYVRDDLPGVWVSYGDVQATAIDEGRVNALAQRGVDPDAMRTFARRWRPADKPDDVWLEQLRRLFARMSTARSVTVLLGAETTYDGLDADRVPGHRRANAIVREAAAGFPAISLLEVDPYLATRQDFTNSIRHYSRRVYHDLAQEIGKRVRVDVGETPAPRQPGRPRRAPAPSPSTTLGRVARRAKRSIRQALGRSLPGGTPGP